MLTKQCPHCHQHISVETLKHTGAHKAYINREVFACPHCGKAVQLPAKAEKTLAIGLLFSVIVAPLCYYWYAVQIPSYIIFTIGAIFIIIGSSTNQLIKAEAAIEKTAGTSMHEKNTDE